MSQIAKKHLLAGIIFGDAKRVNTSTSLAAKSGPTSRSASLNTTVKKKTSTWTGPATSSTT